MSSSQMDVISFGFTATLLAIFDLIVNSTLYSCFCKALLCSLLLLHFLLLKIAYDLLSSMLYQAEGADGDKICFTCHIP